jgi:DNA-binding ferritin-like protein (Dps family)
MSSKVIRKRIEHLISNYEAEFVKIDKEIESHAATGGFDSVLLGKIDLLSKILSDLEELNDVVSDVLD